MSLSDRPPSQDRWLQFFNRIVYNRLPALYDSMDWLTFGAWWHWVKRALDNVPDNQTILEIGFGPGKLHVELAKRSCQAVGLDLASGMCRYTYRRLQRHGLTPRITRGNVLTLPFPPDTFDVIVSTFAFSGFPDGAAAMQEMARVVKSGGYIVLVDIGLPQDQNRAGVFWARLWEKLGDFLYEQPDLMEQAHLQVTTFEEFGPGKHLRLIVGQKPR